MYLLKHVKLHTICEHTCLEITYTTSGRVAISEQSAEQFWEALRSGFSRTGGHNGCLQCHSLCASYIS